MTTVILKGEVARSLDMILKHARTLSAAHNIYHGNPGACETALAQARSIARAWRDNAYVLEGDHLRDLLGFLGKQRRYYNGYLSKLNRKGTMGEVEGSVNGVRVFHVLLAVSEQMNQLRTENHD